ncbi:MAG: hypothetical protein ACI9MB_004814 [Verrucomicrobiales bacterium]
MGEVAQEMITTTPLEWAQGMIAFELVKAVEVGGVTSISKSKPGA